MHPPRLTLGIKSGRKAGWKCAIHYVQKYAEEPQIKQILNAGRGLRLASHALSKFLLPLSLSESRTRLNCDVLDNTAGSDSGVAVRSWVERRPGGKISTVGYEDGAILMPS